MKNTRYNILILKDDHGQARQVQVSKFTLLGIGGFFLLAAVVAGLFGAGTLKNPAQTREIAQLREEVRALAGANERYDQTTEEMAEKLARFEEQAVKLAGFVGVEVDDRFEEGVGGPALDAEIQPFVRYDLGMLEQKTELLEAQLNELDRSYKEHSDRLDSTPSILPARGWISSGMKYRIDPFTKKRTWHNGLDISAQKGTPVYAPAAGVVASKGFQGGFGNLLVINHGNDITTRYAHLDKFNVNKGQRVKRGDLIGYVGNTGRSTAPHLHYEVQKDGKSMNPMKFIIRETQSF